ncbi:MAG: autotransporter assembly complex family protein [Sphingomonadales bacterium]
MPPPPCSTILRIPDAPAFRIDAPSRRILLVRFALTVMALVVAVTVVVEAGIEPARAEERIAYDLRVTGLGQGTSRDLFDETSVLKRQRGTPPAAFAILQQWIQKDVRTLERILRAQGYYAGRVFYQLDRRLDPVLVSITVETGSRYTISRVDLDLIPNPLEGVFDPDADWIRAARRSLPEPGSSAIASRIITAERDMLARLPELGFPNARALGRRVVVRHGDRVAEVRYTVDPGRRVRFGPVTYEGLDSIKPGAMEKLRTWEEGDIFDSRKVSEMRNELAAAGLFAATRIELGEADEDGRTPVTVSVTEADHRSYGGGVGYATDEGFGANVFWEHRNFLGGGERLHTELAVTQISQGVNASFLVPRFLRSDQNLIFEADLLREDPDAYTRYGADVAAAIERLLTPVWSVALGGSLEYARITDQDGQRYFRLVGGLASVRRDNTDDLLDPRRGDRAFLVIRPYVGEQAGVLEFTTAELSASYYLPFDKDRRYVLAARGKIGTIRGASLSRLPADKRFYAGGGQSVRGFGYQFAGDLDEEGIPRGGRSILEVGAEMRIQVTERIGIVPFIDGGRAFASNSPSFSRNLFWGAGLGLRYYTDFAPIRFDVGFPLNGRPEDDAFQIYLSLGQSF